MRPVYLDNHATTKPDPRVVAAMLACFETGYGNASSGSHAFGWEAAEALERAREQVARLIGAEAREVVFTSGATEANNLAIKGVLPSLGAKGRHLVTAATEHKAVLDVFKRLGREGWSVSILPADEAGRVSAEAVAGAIREGTVLASVMAANNEVGTINPISAIAGVCRERGVLFHTDATQAVGKLAVDVKTMGVDLLSLSGHKFHGPKGAGALYVRKGGRNPPRVSPLFDGGGQELGIRSGTVAVPLAVGLGAASEIAGESMEEEASRLLRLRERLHAAIVGRLDGVRLNGHPKERLAGNLNLGFAGVDGELLMRGVREVAVSSGSACSSANPEPSHVLRAIGRSDEEARASLRFGLGRFTTEEEVDFAAEYVAGVVDRLRGGGKSENPRRVGD